MSAFVASQPKPNIPSSLVGRIEGLDNTASSIRELLGRLQVVIDAFDGPRPTAVMNDGTADPASPALLPRLEGVIDTYQGIRKKLEVQVVRLEEIVRFN